MTRATDISAAALAAALLLAAALAGCTSEDPNGTGLGLVSIQVDTALAPLGLRTVDRFAAVDVDDPAVPHDNRQVLYLGGQEGNESAILVNFDFGDIFTEQFPDTLFTRDNIQTVNLSLTMLEVYGSFRQIEGSEEGAPIADIRYWVSRLDAPFDSTLTPPVAVPPHGLAFFQDTTGDRGKEPFLPVSEDSFLAWVDRGAVVGLLIEAGPGSDEGLVGYASRDLRLYSQLAPVAAGTVPAPNFVVNFEQEEENFLLPPVADMSTFHASPAPPGDPTDGFLLRTGRRSYPALLFDFAGLPADAYVNRAVLRVTSDTTRSFGPLTTLWVSELDSAAFAGPDPALTVDALDLATYPVAEIRSVDPYQAVTLEFNVTQYVQRRINAVYEGTRGLVLTGAESFFYAGGRALKPDFYFTEFHLRGTAGAEADSLWPHLRITYTTTAGLEEENP